MTHVNSLAQCPREHSIRVDAIIVVFIICHSLHLLVVLYTESVCFYWVVPGDYS